MQKKHIFEVDVTRDETDRILVSFPELPEVASDGKTLPEALINATDALEEAIAARMTDKEAIPSSGLKGSYHVELPIVMSMKAALYERMRENKVSNVQLADALGIDEKAVRRFLDPRHNTKVEALEKALRHLGVKVSAHFSRI